MALILMHATEQGLFCGIAALEGVHHLPASRLPRTDGRWNFPDRRGHRLLPPCYLVDSIQ